MSWVSSMLLMRGITEILAFTVTGPFFSQRTKILKTNLVRCYISSEQWPNNHVDIVTAMFLCIIPSFQFVIRWYNQLKLLFPNQRYENKTKQI